MAGFMGFSAEASAVLPESAYHARAAREARDGDYAFNARAFPWLYDHDANAVPEIDLTKLTPSQLNQRGATSADGTMDSSSSSSSSFSSSSSSRPTPATGSVGLELTMHESHAGHLIGSIVWDGGKVLSWLLEGLHSRVRQPKPDGSGFVDQDPNLAGSTSGSLSSFTPPAVLEHLAAAADGNAFDLPKDFLVGARVLELGAGTGITGLACVKLGAREVCITDIRELIPLMKENVRRNCPGCLKEEYGKPNETSMESVSVASALVSSAVPVNSSLISTSESTSTPITSSSSSIPITSNSSSIAPQPSAATEPDVPLSSLYLSCDNCDDLSEELFECKTCAQSLCDTCDYSFHRPQSKKDHVRATVSMVTGFQKQQFMADAQLDKAEKQAALPTFPPRCDVYVEELLWGVDSTVETMAPSLRAPFDVIIMADVVYDAYSTSGTGSEHCDNYRRLFHTLCLLTTANTTVLLTYTPRRAPEKQFFELLSQQFVWSVFPAKSLLPFHEEIDERIHIYQLHRSKYAGGNRIKGVVQDVYPYEQIYGSEAFLAAERKRKAEEEQKDRRRNQIMQQQPKFASASSIAIVQPTPAPVFEKEEEQDEANKPAKPTNMNITPTFTRHLEREEERQERLLQEKLAKIALAKKTSLNAPSKDL